jgi:surface antigen
MKITPLACLLIGTTIVVYLGAKIYSQPDRKSPCIAGQPIDSLDGVFVFCNGSTNHISERNVTPDHYNLGMKYQCVEFVKRYYYFHFKHKMPESYGDAKRFFDPDVRDGEINKDRNLIQSTNPGCTKPEKGDILVLNGTSYNPYGHVAIVSKVKKHSIEVIQQNKVKTREFYWLYKII